MSTVKTCPTPKALALFGNGKLSDAQAGTVAAHLETCVNCRDAVATLPADSFLGKVRDANSGSSVPLATAHSAPSRSGIRQPTSSVTNPADVPPELANHPKFRIIRELGRGGMGVIYLAEHRVMEKPVALKVISPAVLDNPEAVARFHAEARAAGKLDHPNIARAHDADHAGSLHFLVMEFVEGVSLAQLVEHKGPLPVGRACHYVRQAALGLQHAFEADMVHRDVKPQNLMLTPNGQVKVLDFGLAKVVRERGTGAGLTSLDSYLGTPDYSAPEQAMNARNADIRADLYSLGCTLYCLLAGRPPFREDTPIKTILAHLNRPPQPLPELRSDVPEGLWKIVARLLAKEAGQRYQTPSAVAQALTPFIKAGAKPIARSSRVLKPQAGSSDRATQLAADTSELHRVLQEVPGKAPRRNEQSPFENLVGPAALPSTPKEAVGSSKRVARGRFRQWMVASGIGLLLAAVLGIWASGAFKGTTGDGTTALQEMSADTDRVPPNPTGTKSDQPAAPSNMSRLANPSTLTPLRTLREHTAPVKHLLFTPDGLRLVSASNGDHRGEKGAWTPGDDNSVRVWLVESGQQIRKFLVKEHFGWGIQGIGLSPDGRRVAACTSLDWGYPFTEPRVFVWDMASGARQYHFVPPGSRAMRAVGFSPDGNTFFTLRSGSELHSWSSADGKELGKVDLEYQNPGEVPLGTTFTPDCKYVLGGTWQRASPGCAVRLWDRETGKALEAFEGHQGVPNGVAISPDRSRILSCANDYSVRMWERQTGRQVLCLDNLDHNVLCVAFAPDGKRIVTGGEDGVVRLWDASTGSELAQLLGHAARVTCVAFSPGGQLLATGSDDTTIHLWQLP